MTPHEEMNLIWRSLDEDPVAFDRDKDGGRWASYNEVSPWMFDGAEVTQLAWKEARPTVIENAKPNDFAWSDIRMAHCDGRGLLLGRIKRSTSQSMRGRLNSAGYLPGVLIDAAVAQFEGGIWKCRRWAVIWMDTQERQVIDILGNEGAVVHGTWIVASAHHDPVAPPQGFVASIQTLLGMALCQEYEWRVRMLTQSGISLSFPTTAAGARALFKDRDLEPGRTRRAALVHWVSEHSRKISTDDDIAWVRRHLRGKTDVSWKGLTGKIYPSRHDLKRPTAGESREESKR